MKIKNKNKIFFILVVSIILLIISLKIKVIDLDVNTRYGFNYVDLENISTFFESVEKNKKIVDNKNDIIAGITPHHLLAVELIAESVSIALQNQPNTVILVGPNHEELGESKMISSDYSWVTEIGDIEPNIEIISKLENAGYINFNNEVIKNDHAIFNILPFIKYYANEIKVVPILISQKTKLADVESFAKYLDENIKEDYVIISSIDFSHYLTAEIAEKKDKETIAYIKDKNIEKIFSLNNDHLDCPACLVLPILINQTKCNKDIQLLKNTNSGLMERNYNVETTSYITGYFACENN